VTDVTTLGDYWLAFDKKDEKAGPDFLVGATFVALNTADMYIRTRG
jgi:hypothetical protein